jgi:predicted lipoprotein with Yx(FWY)xxD motif
MRHPAAAATALAITAALALTGCGRHRVHLASPHLAPVARAVGTGAAGPSAGPLTVQVEDTDTVGRVLADPSGHTLYYDTQDSANSTLCLGSCTDTHHPLLHESPDTLRMPEGLGGTLTLITRPDGGQQVAYDNTPLYSFAGDRQPGDVTGAVPHWRPVQPRDE